jgi:hypothetical protein
MTVEDEVQRLVDIEAIKQLRGRYSRAIDTHDWDAPSTHTRDRDHRPRRGHGDVGDAGHRPHRHLRPAGLGHYAEEYVRTAEGWKIKSSTLTRVRVDTEGEYAR